jgi:ribonuclease Y
VVLNLIVLVVVIAIAALYLIDRRAAARRQISQFPVPLLRTDAPATLQADSPTADPMGYRPLESALGGPAADRADSGRRVADQDAARQAAIAHQATISAEALAAAHRRAEAEAASIVEVGRREADAMRRAAQTEADATRRAAEGEQEAASSHAQRVRAEAQTAAAAIRGDATRAAQQLAEAEVDRLTQDLRITRRDLAAQERAVSEQDGALSGRARELQTIQEDVTVARAGVESREADLRDAISELGRHEAQVRDRDAEVAAREQAHAQIEAEAQAAQAAALERIAELTAAEAKAEVLRHAESVSRRDAAILARDIEASARAEAESRARRIVADAVQRVASDQTAETVVSVMTLASDEMKGRIIGREGRNIRSFEAITGVNVIIDDTPEAVLLSCFDPVRREVGRLTLEKLLLDGRIHPHRIEEVYERSRAEVEELCLRAANDALLRLGIDDLDPALLPTLGRLKYRTSYGQNVLAHSMESAQVAGVMAAEMGLPPAIFERSAFLHDIGKALTHEVEGSHAIVGAELLRRHGEAEVVAHAVEAHHNEVAVSTIEDVLTQAADACSAARPGARRESIEAYVKRLERIEEIASAREGVQKVFAMQAGREVRVMVQPETIDDLEAGIIAREIAKQIEDELTYPGQIRVTVVRESRSTEIAH